MLDQYDDWNAVVKMQREMIKEIRDENEKLRAALNEISQRVILPTMSTADIVQQFSLCVMKAQEALE